MKNNELKAFVVGFVDDVREVLTILEVLKVRGLSQKKVGEPH